MNDMTPFEERFEARVRAFATAGLRSVDSASIARAVAASHPRSAAAGPAVRRFGEDMQRTRPRAVFAAAAAIAVLVGSGSFFVLSRGGLEPRPSAVPSPSLPAAVTLTPTPTASPITNPAGVWVPTGTMGTPRYDHSAVRLLDGRVLVLGGSSSSDSSGESQATSAELYDPLTGTWTATENMIGPNLGFPPTLLRDGRVLVGFELEEDATGAQLYDPSSGTWSGTGQMVQDADFLGDTATLLADGKVLVAGLNGAQVYDPASGTWSATGKMTTPRYMAAATLLRDGRVLVAGGHIVPDIESDVAELYDPSTGSWTAIANMHRADGHRTATLLLDGKVLVAGSSFDSSGLPQFEAEVYDPATGAWTALPVRPGFGDLAVSLLLDGRVLVTYASAAAELYDPGLGRWTTAAPMLRSHESPAILLLDGTVLVAGGKDCLDGVCVGTGAAELYVPAGVARPPLPAFPPPPPPVIPSPTPMPTPFPPEAGPVPPNARPWTVSVVNDSAHPVTVVLAGNLENGRAQLCGSVTPNVVPAATTVEVTFLLPAKSIRGCWATLNLRPGEEGGFFETSDAPMAGKFWIRADGERLWGGS